MFPGSSTLNQISRIVELTGKPTPEDLSEIHSPLALTMFENLNLERRKKSLKEVFVNASTDAIDLIG